MSYIYDIYVYMCYFFLFLALKQVKISLTQMRIRVTANLYMRKQKVRHLMYDKCLKNDHVTAGQLQIYFIFTVLLEKKDI